MRPKNCTFYFCNIFIKPLSMLIIFGTHIIYDTFAITCLFYIFHKLETGTKLKFQQCSELPHCSHTVFKLLCCEMTYAFITPKLWLSNMLDFNAMDYRIWAVLLKWVYQQPVRDVDELRGCLIDTRSTIQQTVIDQTIDQWRLRLRAWVRATGRQFEHLI